MSLWCRSIYTNIWVKDPLWSDLESHRDPDRMQECIKVANKWEERREIQAWVIV
jgi:hypothetical protein